jgi:uncharacterized membrane protein YbhN (UPF0104 family)
VTSRELAAQAVTTRVPPSAWRWLRAAALVALSIVVVAALRNVDWGKTGAALRGADFGWLFVALVANAAILPCWALFWRALRPRTEEPVSLARMLEITSVSSALMNTLPFGGGHASAVVLLIKRGNTSRRGALSILALDQLGEGVVKVMVLLVASIVIPLPAWMRAALTTVLLAVGGWFLVLVLISRMTNELEMLKSARRSAAALACVAGMKLTELFAILAVQAAYGARISIPGSVLVLATVILATMLPISPGNLGAYEASVFLVYRYLGVAPELALSLAIVQHVCFMVPAVGVGYGYSVNRLGMTPERLLRDRPTGVRR